MVAAVAEEVGMYREVLGEMAAAVQEQRVMQLQHLELQIPAAAAVVAD
jgi:hypothetical protein